MSKFIKLFVVALFAFGYSVTAQEDNSKTGPSFIGQTAEVLVAPSLSSRAMLIPADTKDEKEILDGRSVRAVKSDIVPGKGDDKDDELTLSQHHLSQKIPGRTPSLVFTAANSNGQPTDPSIAIGPNHAFAVFNTGIRIFDKNGDPLTGQLAATNIFPANNPDGPGTLCCDLTVSYDNAADRWVLSVLYTLGNQGGQGIAIAVSDGPDPVTADWNIYAIGGFEDYNKLSVWSDGYYISGNVNQPNPSTGNTSVFAMDRAAMLAGETTAEVIGFPLPGIVRGTGGFYAPQFLNVSNSDTPAAGGATVMYQQGDEYAGVSFDHVNVWTVDADFDTPANSTISAPTDLVLTDFNPVFDGGSFNNLTQPGGGGPDIDALQSLIANQAQFRRFSSHNSALFCFVVDVLAGAPEQAGIRWVELRQDGDNQPWTVFQEGTYISPDGKDAWNGSLIMDNLGNIGMGYTAMGGTNGVTLSTYYTGRLANDPEGTMTVEETLILQGTANIPGGGGRYGDYSKIDVDPTDDQTFWFNNEVVNGSRANVVGVFKLAPDTANDVGIVSCDLPSEGSFGANESITVDIFNFGTESASNFDVTYQIDGGTVITEMFTGTIASATTESFTFATTADLSIEGQTYEITFCTALTGDENTENDCTTKMVAHLDSSDVGVTGITAPTTAGAQVTVEISNFGSSTQTSIPVSYSLDGAADVQETYTGSIGQGASDTYTFTATEDLSAVGDYEFVATTALSGDADTSNDEFTATITNSVDVCTPTANCAGFNDGVTQFELADQDLAPECGDSPAGYSDNRDIVFNFVLNDNPFDGTLQMGFANSAYALWIDFNDNGIFEAEELVSDGFVATANADFNFTIDFEAIDAVTTGSHVMRLRGEDEDQAGDVLDPCDDLAFGRTNDYTANISGTLGTADALFAATDLQVHSLGNDQFEVVFNDVSSFSQKLPITVYNTLGQTLAYYTVDNNGGGYTKTIDMSYVSSGVYFVKVGTEDLNKVRRIIVK